MHLIRNIVVVCLLFGMLPAVSSAQATAEKKDKKKDDVTKVEKSDADEGGFSNSDRKKKDKAENSKADDKTDKKSGDKQAGDKKEVKGKKSNDDDAKKASDDEAKKKAKDKKAKATAAKKTDAKDADKKTKAKKVEEKKAKLRQVNLSGSYVDLVQPVAFDPTSLVLGGSSVKQRSFYRLCKFIDDLAKNEQFEYVAFDLSAGIGMNSAQLDELTRHLKKLSDSGIKTYAWLENASNAQLAIAAACDEVVMADFGSVDMPSMAMQSIFFKDAMDLVGVKASVVRAGDFKGAVEPYLKPKMSDHLREHYLTMLGTMNDAQIDRLARGRGMKHADIRELQSKRALLPKDALAAGLVDKLAPYGTMIETIKEEIGEPIDWVTAKAAAKRQVSVFQLMGQMMSGPQNSSGRLRKDTIAVLQLSGAIVDGKKATGGSIVSGPVVSLIENMIKEDKIKGVVVRINSPGGSATASESVRQALVKLAKAKPCVVSMGNMAASGGYWISCIDAPVYAEKGTLTGSIGVFSMKLSAGALMRRVGVHMETITLDDSASIFSMDRPWSDNDNDSLQGMIDHVYDRFLELVSEARGIKIKKLRKLAGGRVWSGTQAKQLKLVDHLGGVDDCLAVVAKKAGLGNDFNVIHRPVARTGLDLSDLLSAGGEEEIWSEVSSTAMRLLKQRGLALETTKLLLRDGLSNHGKPTIWLLNPVEFSVR